MHSFSHKGALIGSKFQYGPGLLSHILHDAPVVLVHLIGQASESVWTPPSPQSKPKLKLGLYLRPFPPSVVWSHIILNGTLIRLHNKALALNCDAIKDIEGSLILDLQLQAVWWVLWIHGAALEVSGLFV